MRIRLVIAMVCGLATAPITGPAILVECTDHGIVTSTVDPTTLQGLSRGEHFAGLPSLTINRDEIETTQQRESIREFGRIIEAVRRPQILIEENTQLTAITEELRQRLSTTETRLTDVETECTQLRVIRAEHAQLQAEHLQFRTDTTRITYRLNEEVARLHAGLDLIPRLLEEQDATWQRRLDERDAAWQSRVEKLETINIEL